MKIWAIYHPDGRIATYEHPKMDPHGLPTTKGQPFEAKYIEIEFQEHLKEFQIELGEQSGLVELVKNWEE